MATLNFLPTEKIRSREVTIAGNRLKAFTAFLGVVCLVVGIGGAALVLLRTTEINALKAEHTKLRTEVLAQETSEQTLVLLRDRLGKFKQIEDKYPSNAQYLEEKKIFDSFPTGVELKQLGLAADSSTFSITASDSGSFAAFVDLMKTSTLANSVIDSFLYSSQAGYQISVIVQ